MSVSRWMTACFLFATICSYAGELEQRLRNQYQGAWIILKTEAYSNCNGFFNDNVIQDGRISSKAKHFFKPGELGKINKINVKRSRISVMVTFSEPFLANREEGPFTLYDELTCKIELRFNLGRAVIKQKDTASIEAAFNDAFVVFNQEGQATTSKLYNQRVIAAYPENYEETLREYEAWVLEQKFVEIDRKIETCLREMGRILARVQEQGEYARGFVAGIRAMKQESFGDCDQMLHAQPSRYMESPKDRVTPNYKDGYEDGQKVAFYQEVIAILRECRP